MFPLQPKVCLFIQNQKERQQSTKPKEKETSTKQITKRKKKHQSIKARKPSIRKTKQFIYVQQEKENKKLPTPENL